MNDATFKLVPGNSPLLISIPHLGTGIPAALRPALTEIGASVSDTDFHLDQLYEFAVPAGATMLSATVSRYIIDINRPPDGASLYPGQVTTGLVPLETFHGEPVYLPGQEPDQAEIARRVETYWQPYHQALAQQIEAIRSRHGFVLLWEAHSINSVLPRLFDGVLTDLNFGTFDGRSAAPAVSDAVRAVAGQGEFSWVLNGRFKGGYITRQYGQPERGIHAVQLEMSQRIYMDETTPFNYRKDLASRVQPLLERLLDASLKAASQAGIP
nr:N-formylglutamate deformylase [Lacisediminimonas profundi]